MLTCAACGAENPAGNRFCGACGIALPTVCPECGTPAPAGFRFCGHCGTPIAAPEHVRPLVVPATERRVCSMLFADLVGFTPLSESRDHEEVRELLTRYFDVARTVVTRYGGVVEKFIGDAVMAVWGTPVASEADAERAVRAGLDLIEAVAMFGDEIGAGGLTARAGVVTGEVAATIGAVGEGMVAGDAVNTAARIQSAAAPGTMCVDEATHRLAAAAIGFTDAGEHVLKGKAAPVRLWQATRVLSSVGGVQRADGLEAPLLGRAAEEHALRELFHAAAHRHAPRLVTVTGPAGMGKSRLGWELEKYVDGLAEAVWWHRGRCLSYGDGVAFWALAEAMRQRFDIAEADPADVASRKFLDRLDELVPDEQQRRFLGVRLGRLLGLTHPDDAGLPLTREELFEGWRQFLEHLAQSAPVLLLVEDAQYADESLLDFLVHVVEWTRQAAIFLVVFGRSELLERRPDLGGGRNRSSLSLDALDDSSMRGLVAGLVSDVPADAVARIVGQAQGNPLFAVETVRSLVDRGVVVRDVSGFRMVGDLGTLGVPDSLHGLLAARLDALPPQLRSLAADASVVGTSFPAEALVEVSGRPSAEVHAGLAELVRREIFDVSADPLSPQRGAYVFSQNLLRQVAYNTLSRRDRRARHLAVARQLQRAFAEGGEEIMDVVARHLLDALEAVGGEDDAELRGQAHTALVRAGDRAVRSGAPLHAARSFVQAAELVADSDAGEAARALEKAQDAYGFAGRYEEAFAAAGRAHELHLARGDTRGAARVLAGNGRWLSRSQHLDEGLPALEQALDELRRDPDADTITAFTALINVYIFTDANDAARALADEALGLAETMEVDDRRMAGLFGVAGLANFNAQRMAEAVAQLRHAVRLAEQAGDLSQRIRSTINLANAYLMIDPDEAAELARSAAALARLSGHRFALGHALSTIAEAQLLNGSWTEALVELAGQDDPETGLPVDEDQQLITAVLLALRGELDEATERAVLPDTRASRDRQDRTYLTWLDAELAAAGGDAARALELSSSFFVEPLLDLDTVPAACLWPLAVRSAFELGDAAEARRLVDVLDARPRGHLPATLRGNLALGRARLLAADDQPDEVVAGAFRDAIAALRTTRAPYFLAHGLLDAAEYDARHGRDGSALRAEATDIAEQLGAADLRRRLALR